MKDRSIPFGEKLLTLVAGGEEQEVNAAVYGEDAVLVLSDAFPTSPSDFTGRGREPYRAALVVRDGKIAENMSVRPALNGGTVTDQGMQGTKIVSHTPNFNHVIVENSEYTLEDCDLRADTESDGKRVCDFDGYGSVVCAYHGAKLTVKNSRLYSKGVAKPVLFADGGSDVLMDHCTYDCMGGTLYAGYQNAAGFTKMVAPPWVLGITGTARGTNLMGELSTMTIANCDCRANDWGVISTDGGNEMALYVVDSKITLLGQGTMEDNPFTHRFGPGYGIYAAGCDEFIYGTEFNVGTYAIIGIGGNITLQSSNTTVTPKKKYLVPTGRFAPMPPDGHRGEVMDVFWEDTPVFAPIQGKGKPTVVNSDGWGFMFHGDCNISLLDGTICDTGYATFLFRAVGGNVVVDNSQIRSGDGVIIQLIDNDDKAVGGLFTPDIYDENGKLIQPHMGPIFNHEFFEHPGYPGIDYDTECTSSGKTVTAKFTNCTVQGDFYNATGYRKLGDNVQGQGEALKLTFGQGASITGIATASTAKHVDERGRDKNLFTMEEYYYLGHVKNQPLYNGVNPVRVILEDDACWTVTGTCLLESLTIGAQATLTAPEGKNLVLKVDGEVVRPEAGKTYTGKLELTVE